MWKQRAHQSLHNLHVTRFTSWQTCYQVNIAHSITKLPVLLSLYVHASASPPPHPKHPAPRSQTFEQSFDRSFWMAFQSVTFCLWQNIKAVTKVRVTQFNFLSFIFFVSFPLLLNWERRKGAYLPSTLTPTRHPSPHQTRTLLLQVHAHCPRKFITL